MYIIFFLTPLVRQSIFALKILKILRNVVSLKRKR